mmetsp:Transcript_36792/g.105453  ORF Transcript_36792/g.105453 Transcript_36792/m.105453 type:complete len:103 (+) Transcript_36792:2296-2604(+)
MGRHRWMGGWMDGWMGGINTCVPGFAHQEIRVPEDSSVCVYDIHTRSCQHAGFIHMWAAGVLCYADRLFVTMVFSRYAWVLGGGLVHSCVLGAFICSEFKGG